MAYAFLLTMSHVCLDEFACLKHGNVRTWGIILTLLLLLLQREDPSSGPESIGRRNGVEGGLWPVSGPL